MYKSKFFCRSYRIVKNLVIMPSIDVSEGVVGNGLKSILDPDGIFAGIIINKV